MTGGLHRAVQGAIQRRRVTELLVDAVNHYSPSYAEEPATRVFARALEDAGVPYQRQPVAGGVDTGGPARANLVVRLGPQPPALVWLGHVDTVAAVDEEHAHASIEDGVLHGLGAADMKSGCAAAVEALLALQASGAELRRGLCVALVVGEEEYGDGCEALLPELTDLPLAVVGEPTSLVPCTHHHGYMECELAAAGARAHAALPEVGSSAIHAMLHWLLLVLEERRELPQPRSVAFNPRAIHGGSEMFAVAERCEASLDVHMSPGVDPDLLHDVVESTRLSCLEQHPGCELSFAVEYLSRGYALADDHAALAPLRAAFERVGLPFAPAAFRSHSDAPLLYRMGTPAVVCGPGALEVAHTPHERVVLDELERAARLYAEMMVAACCEGADAP